MGAMGSKESTADRGRRLAREDHHQVIRELHGARLRLGRSRLSVAIALGIDPQRLGRIEREEIVSADPEVLGALAAVLGLRLKMTLFPAGDPLGDRVQLPMLEAFRARLHPSLAWRTEVGLPIPGDTRAWDAVTIAEDGSWTGIEGISRIAAVDMTLRRANQKQRDDPRIRSVILVVNDTRHNREALGAGIATIRAGYPLDTRAVLACLSVGRTPPLNGIVLQRLPSMARPQSVHTGGQVVDRPASAAAKFVDKPVSGAESGR